MAPRFTPPIGAIRQFIQNDPTCILDWNQTLEVCKEAVRCEPKCFPFIREHSQELVEYVLSYYPYLINEVHSGANHTQ